MRNIHRPRYSMCTTNVYLTFRTSLKDSLLPEINASTEKLRKAIAGINKDRQPSGAAAWLRPAPTFQSRPPPKLDFQLPVRVCKLFFLDDNFLLSQHSLETLALT